LETGDEVYRYDADRALPTASIQKFLTTAAVLQTKGDDFRYETLVAYQGEIVNGQLVWDLIVMGSGDPTLGSDYFEDNWKMEMIGDTLIDRLRALGVKTIT